ncbi:MAG: MMPL family transporter [Myxococcota bacterium]|nr:MMPL family transporter [Myxococcota bacterium]
MRWRIPALLAVVLVTSLAAWQALSVRFDTSIDVWFLEDDPDLTSYARFLEVFESDQMVVLAYRDEQLWTEGGLRFLRDLGSEVLESPHVLGSRSIVTLPEVASDLPGMIVLRRPYDPDPPDPDLLRERVLSDPLLRGLVGEDGQTVALLVDVEPLTDESELKIPLSRALRALGERFEDRASSEGREGVDIRIAGSTMMDAAFLEYSERDLLKVFPLMLLVIVVTILLLFRSPRALALPLAVVLTDCVWVTGLMGATGQELTIIHGIVYPLLLGVGIASSVHVMARTESNRRKGMSPPEASEAALRDLFAPCFFTAVTTTAGLLSLSTASLAPLRQFGVLGASGAFCTFLLTYALGPWFLPFLVAPAGEKSSSGQGLWKLWDRWLARLGALALRKTRNVMLFSLLLVVLSLVGISLLEVGSNPIHYYKSDDPVRLDLEFVDDALTGTSSLEILIDAGEANGVKNPELLRAMKEMQAWLSEIPGVGTTVSIVDYIEELRRVTHGGDASEARIPDTQRQVSQLLMLMDDRETESQLVDWDYGKARISATLKLSQSGQLTPMIPPTEAKLKELFPAPSRAEATGFSKLIANMDQHLLQSAIGSVVVAFITVLFFMTLALRSIRLGLFSMIPNLLPIVMVMGVMGWTGILLDPGTTMIGAVALGLVVDNTVHFLHPFRKFSKRGMEIGEATSATLLLTGRAIVTTTIVLVCGFWLLLLASFNPNIYFGLLCGLAVLCGLVADLVVLPAALMLIKPKLD